MMANNVWGKRAWLWLAGAACAALLARAPVQAGPLAVYRTAFGEIHVELYADKPVTTANFIRYVKSGAYTNMFFHRWVPGFVIQGGGIRAYERGTTNAYLNYVQNYGTITNEYAIGRNASNLYGTLAMAKVSGNPNSASSQWFFNLANNTSLDTNNGGFTVFGRVVRGTNVLNQFNDVSGTKIWMVSGQSPLNELPILSTNAPTIFDALVYCNISLLELQARPAAGGGVALSWQSVSNIANVVEYTTQWPPVWNTLTSTNGNGQTLTIQDAATADVRRYYRVRIQY